MDSVALVVAVLIAMALLVVAVILVNRQAAIDTAYDARVSILAEEGLSSAAALENATSRAVLVAALTEEGRATESPIVSEALSSVRQLSEAMHRRLDTLASELTTDERTGVASSADALDTATEQTFAAIEGEDPTATTSAAAEHHAAYETLVDELVAIRDDHGSQVLIDGDGPQRAADAARFLIFFIVPLTLVIGYRRRERTRARARNLEAELARERAMKQSRDDFVADLSHELRTPLTGIYGFALALNEMADLTDDDRELVTHIVADAAELTRMVDDLIATGRMEVGTLTVALEPTELVPIVTDVAAVSRMRGIDLSISVPDVIVKADRIGLRQVLVNLVSNAARHGGDSIVISAEVLEGAVHLRVIDDGPGVDDEVEPLLFARYVHGEGQALVSGTIGLGTSVAAAYVDAFGGTIEYYREDDHTVFDVRLLPVLSDASLEEAEAALV